jgi:hypothetical protein
MNNFNLPEDIDELFSCGEETYSLIDYDLPEMDNIQSMNFFVNLLDIPEENIIVDDGTMIIVEHPDFDFNLRIDAGGLGDFHSHEWRVSIDE